MTYVKNMLSYASISSNTTLLEGYHYNCTGLITLVSNGVTGWVII